MRSIFLALLAAPLALAQQAAGPGKPGLVATYFEYSTKTCASDSQFDAAGVQGLANTCNSVSASQPVLGAEVGTIPALQNYKTCQGCLGEQIAAQINKCAASKTGAPLKSVFVKCS